MKRSPIIIAGILATLITAGVQCVAGAKSVPKDGPSAGITMVSSMVSALRGQAIRHKVAMTGEMTLRGKVLPVGGIKEKILAAKRAGVTDIVISVDNRKDIEDIKPVYVEGLTFHYVRTIDDVMSFIFS